MADKLNNQDQDELSNLKSRILDDVLPDVPFDGWTRGVMMKAADRLGIERGEVQLAFPCGPVDLVSYFLADGDRRMVETLEKTDLAALKIREKVTLAVRTRLEVDTEHREAIRRAGTYLAMPISGTRAPQAVYHTVDAIWRAIGDTSTDYNFYTKRATLSLVYASTLTVWLGDDSDGLEETWAFLDRRIAGVMQFEKVKAQVTKVVDKLPNPLGLLARLRYRASRS
ncbi:MAG: COQ9 family protein [Parvibaculaceae bacterium]|nr:COQ9 family protein [Parvibaculaceae bacterium]